MSSRKSSTSSSRPPRVQPSVQPRVLVTGCYGALGAYLTHRLVASGWRVDGIDLPTARPRPLPPVTKVHHIDIATAGDPAEIVGQQDGIVHLAGYSRIGSVAGDPFGAIRSNILGTAAILDAIRCAKNPKKNPPWLLFASSLEVKTDANGAYGLTNLYGLTKAVSELLSHRYAADYGLVIAAPRIAGIYGLPDDYANKVPLVFVKRALAGESLTVSDDPRAMDYIHVDDVCAALMSCMRQLARIKGPAFCAFPIESGRKIKLKPLARLIQQVMGTDVPVAPMKSKRQRNIAARRLRLPRPRVELEEGLWQLAMSLHEADTEAAAARNDACSDRPAVSLDGRPAS